MGGLGGGGGRGVGRVGGGRVSLVKARESIDILPLPAFFFSSSLLPSPSAAQAMGEKRFLASKYELAAKLFASTILGGGYSDFLTTLCYEHILSTTGKARM